MSLETDARHFHYLFRLSFRRSRFWAIIESCHEWEVLSRFVEGSGVVGRQGTQKKAATMTTSSPIFRQPPRGFGMSRILVASVGAVLAVALFAAGFAQTVFPAVRSTLAEVYVGVPGWLFILGGLYQVIAAALMVWPKTRVTGAMHAGAISLVTLGFNVFGDETLWLIPINIALAMTAFLVAWFFTTHKVEDETVDVRIGRATTPEMVNSKSS